MRYLLTWSEGEEVEYRLVDDLNSIKRSYEEKYWILTPLD